MPSWKPVARLCLALAVLLPVGVLVTYAAAAGGGTPVLPDVIEEVPQHLQIQNTQQGEWLRFTTTHINVGAGNLQIRGGGAGSARLRYGLPPNPQITDGTHGEWSSTVTAAFAPCRERRNLSHVKLFDSFDSTQCPSGSARCVR